MLRRVVPLAAAVLWLATVLGMVAARRDAGLVQRPLHQPLPAPVRDGHALAVAPVRWPRWRCSGAASWPSGSPIRTRILGDLFFPGMFATVFWLAGRSVRSRSELTAELHEAAVQASEARDTEARRAVAEERRRIAREMHDVVGHSVSMMVVQAGGARRILDRDPARAIAAAELIERTGREALAEMRRLLGVLHAADHAEPEYAPQPSLRGLEALVERARAAGVPVELAVDGDQRELPAGLDLAAYRVVQEALTNVRQARGRGRRRRCACTTVPTRWRCGSRTGAAEPWKRASTAAVTASSACASACACTAASCTPAGARTAASRSTPCCRSRTSRTPP